MKSELIQHIAVTFELCGGTTLSDAAKESLIDDLEEYPERAVEAALVRCRREVKGHLAPSDIIQRIDDGRPGANEAWGMVPKSEAESVVWCVEMAEAYEIARDTISRGDLIAGRCTFIDAYNKRVQEARSARVPVSWSPSLGTDPGGRERVIRTAVSARRIGAEYACRILPGFDAPPALPESKPVPELPSKTSEPEHVRDFIPQVLACQGGEG